jgi:hypothetical protein
MNTVQILIEGVQTGFAGVAAAASSSVKELGASAAKTSDNFVTLEQRATAAMASIKAGAAGAMQGMGRIGQGAKEAAEGVTHMLGPIQMMREMLGGVGEALIAAFAVKEVIDFSQKMGEAGEKVEHTAERLGLSVGEVQKLGAMATLTGIQVDQLTNAVGRLDRNFGQALGGSKQQVAAFKELGINIHEIQNQSQLLDAVASHWNNLHEGIQQNTVAITLFGRAGAALIPFLQQGQAGVEALNRVMAEYGIKNDDAVAKEASLGEAWNENKLATQGLNNVLAQSLAPTMEQIVRLMNGFIAQIIRSYEHGGIARRIFDGLAVVLKALATVVIVVSGTIYALGVAFGALIEAALSYAKLVQGDLVGAIYHEKRAMDDLKASVDAVVNSTRALVGLWSGKGAGGTPFKPPPVPKDQVSGIPGPKAKKAPKVGSDEAGDLEKWREELAQKLALDTSFGHDDVATTLAFWQSKLQLAKDNAAKEIAAAGSSAKARAAASRAGQKEILAVETEIAKAQRAKHKEDAEMALSEAQTQLNIQRGALTTELDVAKEGAARKKALIDEQHKAGLLTERQALADKAAIDNQLYSQEVDEVDREYRSQLDLLAKKRAVGDLTIQEVQKIQEEEETLTAAHYQRLEQMAAQHATKVVQDQVALADSMRSTAHGWVDPVVNAWANGVEGMIEGTTNFRQAVQGVFRSLVSDIIGHIAKMVSDWIVQHLFMSAFQKAQTAIQTATVAVGQTAQTGAVVAGQTAQTAATVTGSTTRRSINLLETLKIIAQHAASAAAGAYSALAPIPIIGPILGAAAAVATFAAVLALGSLASAAGGWGNVPEDQLAQVHKKEMVLPATIATPLRDAIDRGVFSNVGGGGAGALSARANSAADVRHEASTANNLNYSPTIHAGEPDLMRLVERQGTAFMAHIANMFRNGEFRA